MEYYSVSDKGRVRQNNEDSYLNYVTKEYSLFIVCDGLGGHNSGEVASELATLKIKEYIEENFDKYQPKELLSKAIYHANNIIYEKSSNEIIHKNMGTTVVVSLIIGEILYFANAGDSRIYIFSNNNFKQISKDHSYVQEMLDIGAISEEDAKFFPKNQITSCLGTSINFKLFIDKIKLSKSDMILMTTDGLTDMIDDEDIVDVLKLNYGVRDTVEILTYMANSTGGKDNITITFVRLK